MLAPVGKTERPRDALTLGFWGIRQRRLTRARGRKLTRHDGNFVGNLVNFQVLRRGASREATAGADAARTAADVLVVPPL